MQRVSIFVAAARFFAAFCVGANRDVHAGGQSQSPDPAGQATYGATATPQGGVQGGAATAGVFAPVLDSEKRPITAGGFVKTGAVLFVGIAGKGGGGGGGNTKGE